MRHTTTLITSQAGYVELARILETLPLFPLTLYALLLGRKVRPFLAEVTGLSQSHLRRGKNPRLRKATESRAIESVKQWGKNSAAAQGWSEAEIKAHMQAAPSHVVGEPRPYADFIYGLQIPGRYELPQSIAFAEEIDMLVARLQDAHQAGNLEAFRKSILECNLARKMFGSVGNQQEAEQYEVALHAASDWNGVVNAVQIIFPNLVLSLFAALDAEYGLIFFQRLKPRPIFLLVMPRMNPQSDLQMANKRLDRNFVYQPVRRLLELSHALMIWVRDQRWPDKPVGRKELGEALGLEDQHIGNFFDGTRKMNAKIFDGLWVKMCETVAKCEPFSSPLPLLLAAIYWQSCITRHPNQKLKSFILPDDANYTKFWSQHRRRWASQLDNGTVSWPDWLGGQSS